MSLINTVLRDLDRRNAAMGAEQTPPPAVKVVATKAAGHELFWRIVAFLVLAALGWVAWVFYQIQPRPIATELAERAAEQARVRPKPPVQVAQASPQPAAPTQAPVEALRPSAPVTEPRKAAAEVEAAAPRKPPAVDLLRLAPAIETPIPEAAPRAEQPAPRPKVAAAEKAKAAPKKAAEKPRFERRDRVLTAEERADTEFRRSVDLLKRGRAGEAQAGFVTALKFDSRHRGARQALVALKLERGQLEEARRLLEDGLAIDPAQPDFAVALARVQVERDDLPAALAALEGSASGAANHAEFHALRGTILQRLGRHADAADAYRAALRVQASIPSAWMGLGISLEALQRRAEAAQAFRNALAAGPVSAELRTFAEQRIQALR